jgi:hypothetical protein
VNTFKRGKISDDGRHILREVAMAGKRTYRIEGSECGNDALFTKTRLQRLAGFAKQTIGKLRI